MAHLINGFIKSEFQRNVLKLVAGTGLAQAIPVLISPFLARIYQPEDFGTYALFSTILSIIMIFATGRYETAIMLAQDEEEVSSLAALISIILVIVTILATTFVFFFIGFFKNYLGGAASSFYLHMLPFSLVLTGIYQIINCLLIRDGNYNMLATNKIIFSFVTVMVQLLASQVGLTNKGLLLGNVAAYIITILFVLRRLDLTKYFSFKALHLLQCASKFSKFPKYDLPSTLLNYFGSQLPLLVMGSYFGTNSTGQYSLVNKVFNLPMGILSNSLLDVFKKKASDDYRKLGNCRDIFEKTFKRLFCLGLLPLLIFSLFAAKFFVLVFGQKWVLAGQIAQLVLPLLSLKLVVSPLSFTFYIAEKQHIDFWGQVLLLILTIVSVIYGISQNSLMSLLNAYVLSYSLIYLLYIYFSYNFAKGKS